MKTTGITILIVLAIGMAYIVYNIALANDIRWEVASVITWGYVAIISLAFYLVYCIQYKGGK